MRLQVRPESVATVQQAEERLRLVWAVSMGFMGLLLTNVPAYLRYRDRPTLFYLCTQVEAMLYLMCTLPANLFY